MKGLKIERIKMDYYRNKFLEDAKKDGVENPAKLLSDFSLAMLEKSEDLQGIVESHVISDYGLDGIKFDAEFYGIDKKKYWTERIKK
tara:strand:+ start:551 stop:811 length:261 start_codon:yes stop_codon:yes gene_type:complete